MPTETTPALTIKEALLIANLTEIAADHRARGSLYQAACMELSLDLLKARADKIERLYKELSEAREALMLAEKADRIHGKCQECEDGAQAPEACGDCFPSADDARVARRTFLAAQKVKKRDIDRSVLSPKKDQSNDT